MQIAKTAASLDAPKLRAAIGEELHLDAVTPEDPRAAEARGTLDVGIDRDARQLVVTYRAAAAPVRRAVALPADGAQTASAAVVLAGNLARDEASELASQLRGRRAPEEPPPPPPTPKEVPPSEDMLHGGAFEATLAFHADDERHSRVVFGWTSVVAGMTGNLVGTAVARSVDPGLGSAVMSASSGVTLYGFLTLFEPREFGKLLRTYREGAGLRATEEAWVAAAADESSRRKTTGAIFLVVGGLALGMAALGSFDTRLYGDAQETRVYLTASFLGLGAFGMLAGIHRRAVDGPVQTGLGAYQRATGRALEARGSASPRVMLLPGGAALGFGGTF